jgi:hypothetical protein
MGLMPERPQELDPAAAAALVGKHVLVGLTYENLTGQPIEEKQVHGRVVRVTASEGIVLALEPSGEEFAIPALLGALRPATPGEYRLHSTGEVVMDPDFLATFSVKRPTKA